MGDNARPVYRLNTRSRHSSSSRVDRL